MRRRKPDDIGTSMILVDKFSAEDGVIYILRSIVTGAYAYWQGDCCHSEIDANGVSLAPYINAIYDLIRQSEAQNILMIGCAGGTLATILTRAGHTVTIVDIEPKSFDIARRYFNLPPETICVVDDGLNYLSTTDRRFSAIVVDAFVHGVIPPHLRSAAFFEAVRSRLSVGGHVYLNIIIEDDFDPSMNRIAHMLSETGFNVSILDIKGAMGRNAVIVAGEQISFERPRLTVNPSVMRHKLRNELERMQFYTWLALAPSH